MDQAGAVFSDIRSKRQIIRQNNPISQAEPTRPAQGNRSRAKSQGVVDLQDAFCDGGSASIAVGSSKRQCTSVGCSAFHQIASSRDGLCPRLVVRTVISQGPVIDDLPAAKGSNCSSGAHL